MNKYKVVKTIPAFRGDDDKEKGPYPENSILGKGILTEKEAKDFMSEGFIIALDSSKKSEGGMKMEENEKLGIEKAEQGKPVSNLELVVEEAMKVEEGSHEAEISKVEIRNTAQGWKYCDIFFQLENEVEVKCGFPAKKLTATSSLGIFVKKFMPIETGEKVDLKKLIGRKVKFVTSNEKTEKGEFARVVKESIKAVEVD